MATAESMQSPTVEQAPEFEDVLDFMRLFWAVEQRTQSVSRQMEADSGITLPQRLVLGFIARSPGIRPSELARMLHLHRSTLSGIIGRLEKAGHLIREADPNDARLVHLHLSRKGKWFKDNSVCVESIFRRTMGKLSVDEIEGMKKALEVLAAEFAKSGR